MQYVVASYKDGWRAYPVNRSKEAVEGSTPLEALENYLEYTSDMEIQNNADLAQTLQKKDSVEKEYTEEEGISIQRAEHLIEALPPLDREKLLDALKK